MHSIRIDVDTPSRRYPILIADNLAAKLGALLRDAGLAGRRFIVSNPLVWRLHGAAVGLGLPDAQVVLIPDGERYKTLSTVARIYDALIHAGADRTAVVVAVGGGVVGDTAGYAAATYLRGIALAHVPTTLLAQVDSAVGGKVGVNHPLGKNLIGAFYQPCLVAVDPGLLATLKRREFRAGLYEVVKYGLAFSAGLFVQVQRHMREICARDPTVLLPLIAEACRIKAAIVEQDEREAGARALLNLGHTTGHALETLTRYRRFRHGEAVAYGLLVACRVAAGRSMLAADAFDTLAALIRQLGPLPPVGDLRVEDAIEAMRRDKKVRDGALHFVLPTRIGSATIVNDVTESELTSALRGIGLL